MYGGDEVSALVIDIGHYQTRIGYAGEDSPKIVVPSVVGTIRPESKDESMDLDTRYITGHDINFRRDGMILNKLLENGQI